MNKHYYCNYLAAIKWCGNNYIFIPESAINTDELDFVDDFSWDTEVFQYYISDCSTSDAEFLCEHFDGVHLAYSETYDTYILCVTHFGTSWDHCLCETDLDNAECGNGEEPLQAYCNKYHRAHDGIGKLFIKQYGYTKKEYTSGRYVYTYKGREVSMDDMMYALGWKVSKSDLTSWSKQKDVNLYEYMNAKTK